MDMTQKNPVGPNQQRWFAKGYQTAMAELAALLDRGGDDAVREYIENSRPRKSNATPARPRCPGCDSDQMTWCEDNWACLRCGDEWSKGQVQAA